MDRRNLLSGRAPGMRIALARAAAGARMPYFTSGIHSLSPLESPGLGTMGCTETGFLLYDPEFLGKLTVEEAGTVVLHEYMHDFLNHAARFREMTRRGVLDDGDHELWNVACDAEINDNLEEAGCAFPSPEAIGWSYITPQRIGMTAHRTAEEYAVRLKKKGYKANRPSCAGNPGHQPACGSASGNPLDGEPEADDPNAQDALDREIQRKGDAAQVVKHQRMQGNVPGGIMQVVGDLLKESEVSWEQELQAEVLSSVRHKSGLVDYTFTEQSRMQGALWSAFGEEAPMLPGMWAPLANVALVIDTSGSMSNSLKKCVEEAHGILRAVGGARVTLVACDAEVHELREVSTVEEVKASLKGGGGTNFRPAFQALEKLPKKRQPDIVVFATDGWGSYPSKAPKWKHIWLCVGGRISVDWGQTIEVKEE